MKLIECPSCGKQDFEIHHRSTLSPVPDSDVFVPTYKSTFYTCMVCGYRLDDAGDLKLTTIDVYIVGDSISGRRQGLTRIIAATGFRNPDDKFLDSWKKASLDRLANEGYFPLIYDSNGSPKEGCPFVFTKGGWKRAEADPGFRLMEGQYAVNLKEMV